MRLQAMATNTEEEHDDRHHHIDDEQRRLSQFGGQQYDGKHNNTHREYSTQTRRSACCGFVEASFDPVGEASEPYQWVVSGGFPQDFVGKNSQ